MQVGARSWQVHLMPHWLEFDPWDMVDINLESPIRPLPDFNARFEFDDRYYVFKYYINPEWRKLPKAIKHQAAAVAVDMSTVNLLRSRYFNYQGWNDVTEEQSEALHKLALMIEEICRNHISYPYTTTSILEVWTLVNEVGIATMSMQPFEAVYTAFKQLMEQTSMGDIHAVINAIESFSCYDQSKPLDRHNYIHGNFYPWEPRRMYSDEPEPRDPKIYISESESALIDMSDCTEPWFKLWWQEVLETLAFRRNF